MKPVLLDAMNVSKCFQLREHKADSLKETIQGYFRSASNQTDIFWAIKNLSFQLYEGEVLGIIGKNGAGKSTLLRILSGITKPDEGHIDFYGKTASVLDVGAGFHPDLSGRENIFLAAQLYGLSRKEIEERYQRIVAFSGIEKFMEEPVKNYSAGMYLRLAFAVVTEIDASILIFDEVLGVGDAEFQHKVNEYLSAQAGKKSFIIVSHNLQSIGKLCDRILLLDQGEWKAEGTLDVIGKYLESIVAMPESTINTTENNHVVLNEKIEDGDVILKWVSLSKENDHAGVEISNMDPISISAALENAHGNEDIVFQVHDQYDSPLFATSTLEALEIKREVNEQRETIYTCHIPGCFFNKGVFTLNVFLVIDKTQIQWKRNNVLKFKINLAKRSSTSVFSANYPGGIKPLHHWTILN